MNSASFFYVLDLGARPIAESSNYTAFWAGVAAVAACVAVFVSIYIFCSNNKKEESLFYLKQIKEYFNRAVSLLTDGNNNNIKWHQAIEYLKTAHNHLKAKLTDETHKHIYLLDYRNTAYEIITILNRADSDNFFYGIKEYEGRDSDALFEEAKRTSSCIFPEYLLFLCSFLEKANQCDQAINVNKSSWEKVYNSEYFSTDIVKGTFAPGCPLVPQIKKILDYVGQYKGRENSS